MAEYDPQKVGYLLEVGEEYHNTLDIEGFSRMMQSPSYCYKFYWLEAIVKLISQNKEAASYNEIIDEMIANAWYSVLEFHVHPSEVGCLLPEICGESVYHVWAGTGKAWDTEAV